MLRLARGPLVAAMVAVTLTIQGASGLFARPAADACPLSGDDCCANLRLSCCDLAPAPGPANVPAAAQSLRAPVLSTVTLPPAAVAAGAAALGDAGAYPSSPPHRPIDLPVFLHTLLI